MNYCALDDAFQEIGGAPSPGCATDYSTRAARKEERKKAKRCKGPAGEYLNQNQDPDRQQFTRLPDVPAMNHMIGLKEHAPVTGQYSEGFAEDDYSSETPKQENVRQNMNPSKKGNPAPASSPKYDKDPLASYVVNEARAKVMTVPTVTEQLTSSFKKNFFGADPDADDFADYMPEQDNYRLQPDFHNAFEHAGVARAGSADAARLPNPSVNMFWKPLTQTGGQTAFMEHLPPPGGKYYRPPAKHGEVSMEEVMKKMDKIFARLDDMNVSSPEQITSELMMFVSSGIFVLFMMNLLVKKGSTLRF